MNSNPSGGSSDGADPAGRKPPTDPAAQVEVCASCHRPLIRQGEQGACAYCLVHFADGLEEGNPFEPAALSSGLLTAGNRRYGHFEILTRADGSSVELGHGAMGVTYRAQDTVLHRAVALKIIDRGVATHPAARARFLREARAAAQFQHANVAAVSHYGEQDGECFYVMELVEGETLEARLRRDGPLQVGLVLEVAAQTAQALMAAEARGIIHRDLKPSNLMLTASEGERDGERLPLVKVIDFGLAKAVTTITNGEGGFETRGDFVGTPSFASPEQFSRAEGSSIDHRSDIYSLGVTMWYALCGKTPFVGQTLANIRERQTDALPLEQLASRHVPPPVVELLKDVLALDPARRPQSARELFEALRRCQTALQSQRGPNEGKRIFRRLAAATALAMILAILGGLWWWSHRRPLLKPEDRSIAVLPFENRSVKPADAFYATAVQDEITADLARVSALRVVSPQSVGAYPAGKRDLRRIGRELGVRFLLEGSVERAENQVKVTTRLFDLTDVEHPWVRTYDRQPADIFLLQGEVTQGIADRLQTQLSDQEKAAIDLPPTTDLAAYDLYLRASDGPQLVAGPDETRAAGNRALGLLKEAVARDPHFVRAYCDMAKLQDMLYLSHVDVTPEDRTIDRRALAESALAKARQVQPDAGEVHLATASHLLLVVNDREQAQVELAAAQRTLPNDPEVEQYLGLLAERSGHLEEAVRAYAHEAALDPCNPVPLNMLANVHRRMRRYEEADGELTRLLGLRAGKYVVATQLNRAMVALEGHADLAPLRAVLASPQVDDGPPSVPLFRLLLACFDRNADSLARALAAAPQPQVEMYGSVYPNAWFEALGARTRGDEAAARAAFIAARPIVEQSLHDDPSNLNAPMVSLLALIDAGLGRRDEALREAKQACEMLPPSVSRQGATVVNVDLALVYAWTGQSDLAIAQLEPWLKQPAAFGVPFVMTYGDLKLDPVWDPLRADPRFSSLVGQLAPAQPAKISAP